MCPEPSPAPQELASTISNEMVRIHVEAYGQGTATANTYVMDDLVLSVVDIELLPSERVLIDAGREDLVRRLRRGFQEAIDASLKAAVERATGRTVVAFVNATHIDPSFTVELFRLDGGPSSASMPEDV